mmetsp:Transcript_79132/g.219955  ORF Transcript_79132/g.219955 Transcript_79132/m.219955 type:complete len:135 (+) Transcript_79132:111-515(+)
MRGTLHDPIDGQSRDVIAAKQAAPLERFEQQRRQDREARRSARDAEGGRGGGYNDRQEVVKRSAAVDDGEYDDFGRRVKGKASGAEQKQSKTDRAAAALERLRQKGQPAKQGCGENTSGHRRSRSRSGERPSRR